MVRGESVAVIYLSLLVCLALVQGSGGRGTTHNTTLVNNTHTHLYHSNTHTQNMTTIEEYTTTSYTTDSSE